MAVGRIQKELTMLEREPPPGISVWPVGDQCQNLEAGTLQVLDCSIGSLVHWLIG
jgi:ubiquitin-protein ligase